MQKVDKLRDVGVCIQPPVTLKRSKKRNKQLHLSLFAELP